MPESRPFWSGALTFGLVTIPVDLYPASHEGGTPLRTLADDGTPLVRRYYCPEDGEEIASEDLVLGYELESGKYVVVTDEELSALDPKKSREIDLRLFVKRATLDPLYFERGYFLAPSGAFGKGASGKAYNLLASVMARTKRAGIATFVMREREYLVAILADGGVLRAETLRFRHQVRSPADVGLPKMKEPPKALVSKLDAAIKALETPRLPTAELTDDHGEALKQLARRKLRRKEDVVRAPDSSEAPAGPGAEVIDLMDMLKRSLQGPEARGRKAAKTAST